MITGKLVGARVKRVEDPRFVTGNGAYVSSMSVPGMVDLALLRSPHAHARIRSIDATRALAHPGVFAVLTGEEMKKRARPLRSSLDREKNPTYKESDWHSIAVDKIRFCGEAVAAVVAVDRYVAEDALGLIDVDYEVLVAVVDAEEALSVDSPLVHDEWGDNILCHNDYSIGDPDGGFDRAAAIVKQRFRTGRHQALPLETRGCIARHDKTTGDFVMWTSSQMPHLIRTQLGIHLDYPENKIRVIAPDVGGGFGLKCHLFAEEVIVAVAAMEVGRPVRWLEDRQEAFTASYHAKEQVVDGELAVGPGGEILAARFRGIADIGAYSSYPWTSAFEVLHAAQMLPGPYRLQHYAFSATSVATNKSTSSVYRGVGAPVATMVMEGLLDLAANELGMDPLEIRRRNMIRREDFPYTSATGLEYEEGSYLECLDQAADLVDYATFRREQNTLRERGVYRGLGVSCYNEITALGSSYWHAVGVPISAFESSNIRIDPSGRVTLFAGTHSQGQAHETIYAQIAADHLGIPFDQITVRLGDTSETPYGWGTWGSRAAVTGGGAVTGAAKKMAAKLRRLAGHHLEVAPDDIELEDGVARVKGVPGRELSIAEIARRAIYTAAAELPAGDEPGLDETHYYEPPPVTFPNAAHIAIVEVDIETGAVEVLRYAVVEDCGIMINPMVVDGQIAGGVAQGFGGAMLEHLIYDDAGQPLTTSFMDYLVPSAADVPPIDIGHIETPSPLVPGGFKGTGEGGAIAPFGAMANAVSDALRPFGARAAELPITPERVRAMANPL